MSERKIIQISSMKTALHALCNDGSVWRMSTGGYSLWEKLASIPQPPPPEVQKQLRKDK